MANVIDVLVERGYIEQFTHEEELRELLDKEKITFYIGFDPTADSLHVGSFIQMMVMAHMQRAGHRPIVLLGGGTAMIGDPSGKTDMRKMLTMEQIAHNAACYKKQFERVIDFSEGKAIMANNADWLMKLNYVDFLREIGVHFSVNRMLSAESVKQRLERGLTFLEFNYMLMQGYDFYELHERYGCVLQFGGNDQWTNIISGVELVRKKLQKPAFGVTIALLTNSQGQKMGKTVSGALWLDKEKTSPYDFYQYFRNVDDADVQKCLALLTFLNMDEVRRLGALEGSEINEAKKVLAFEVTKLIHGEEEAIKAQAAAEALFAGGADMSAVPATEVAKDQIGVSIVDLLVSTKIMPSKGEARRLIQQGGLTVNDEKVEDTSMVVAEKDFIDGGMMIRRGKKNYNRLVLK
ncbi:MAG TPA: tyrosine--tRNA ligase [Clostridiaceae bacterium]